MLKKIRVASIILAMMALTAPALIAEVPDVEMDPLTGCNAQLNCLDGSSVACSCSTPFGVCEHDQSSNPWGGSVTCDCEGVANDTTDICEACNLSTPSHISGPDLCQGSIENYQTSAVAGATNYRWEILATPIARNTSSPTLSLSGHYFYLHDLGPGSYTMRVRAEKSGCTSPWRSVTFFVLSNGDPECTICDLGDKVCF